MVKRERRTYAVSLTSWKDEVLVLGESAVFEFLFSLCPFLPGERDGKEREKESWVSDKRRGERYKGWLMKSSPSRGRLLSSFEESGKDRGGHDEM